MPDTRGVSISERDFDALTATVISEVTGVVPGMDWAGNIRGVVDSVIGRAAVGKAGGWPTSVEGVVNQKGQYSGISKAGGWENFARGHMKDEKAAREVREVIADRLAEIATYGRVSLAPDFQNIGTVLGGNKSGSSSKKDARSLANNNISGPLAAPGGFHTYGLTDRARGNLAANGVVGPGVNVSLSFSGQLAPAMSELMASVPAMAPTPREALAQPFSGPRVDPDFVDMTDVLAQEQLGIPDLPGPLADLAPPNWSLADLAPEMTQPPAPDWSPFGDRTTPSARGPATDPYGFSTLDIGMPSAQISGLPGVSPAAAAGGVLSAQAAPAGGGYGVTSFGPDQFGTVTAGRDAEQTYNSAGTYDWGNPLSAGSVPGAWDTPRTDFDRTQSVPSLADLAGFDPLDTARESFPDSPLAGLSPTMTGTVGHGLGAGIAAEPTRAAGMSFDNMTRGITGYTTETVQVPNPAYTAWEDSYAKPNSYQQAYLDDMDDKFPGRTANFQGSVLNQAPATTRGPAPARTIDKTVQTPVYGDIPRGHPVSATLTAQPTTNPDYSVPLGGTWGGLDNWGGYMSGQGMLGSLAGLGVEGMTGTIGGGLSDPGNANTSASAGGFSGGFGDARGGGVGANGAPLGGSENQGGAASSSFGGSQGSDPSGRGGLY